jgi:hypothetical protein
MKRKWPVLFCLLTVVLLSGCAAGMYPKGATEDYKKGYQHGMKVGYTSGEGFSDGQLAGLIGMPLTGSYAPSKLPDKEQQKIQEESLEYQRGFTKGWGQGVRSSANSYSMIFGIIYSEDD